MDEHTAEALTQAVPPPREQRSHLRVTLLREILCEGAAGRIRSEIGDISVGGMFVDAARPPFRVGDLVTVRFFLAYAGPRVATEAEVNYVQSGIGMGLRFTSLTDDARDAIAEFVEATSRQTVRGDPNMRKSARVSIIVPVTVSVPQADGTAMQEQTSIITLSKHGACVLTNSAVDVGMKLLLEAPGGKEFAGSVVWVGATSGPCSGQVGIQSRGLAQALGFQFP